MLRADQLELQIRSTPLLQGAELTVSPGQMIGLIGHNGSGKSTLLRLLARQLRPTRGQLSLNGQPYEDWPAQGFARQVAYLPQHLPPSPGLTVRELVGFGRYPWRGALGRLGPDDEQRMASAMARTDVLGLKDRWLDQLSGGERQRAWLAMLLAQDARYLLLDEPTSALDLAHQSQILTLLRELCDGSGLGMVLVLHDLNMAAHHCDQLVALKGGRLLAAGPSPQLMVSDTLERIYDVPMTVVPRPDAASVLAVVRAG